MKVLILPNRRQKWVAEQLRLGIPKGAEFSWIQLGYPFFIF